MLSIADVLNGLIKYYEKIENDEENYQVTDRLLATAQKLNLKKMVGNYTLIETIADYIDGFYDEEEEDDVTALEKVQQLVKDHDIRIDDVFDGDDIVDWVQNNYEASELMEVSWN